jgi:hypothetical protein
VAEPRRDWPLRDRCIANGLVDDRIDLGFDRVGQFDDVRTRVHRGHHQRHDEADDRAGDEIGPPLQPIGW